MSITIDKTDAVILFALQRDGRLSNVELAERVSLSPSACLRRVQALERLGVIAGYRAIVDTQKIGLGLQAFVRVHLRSHDAADVARFIKRIEGWDEVLACHALTGEMDYLLQVLVEDLDHFSRFLLDKLLSGGGVADVNTSFVLRTVKQAQALPVRIR